MSGSPEAGRCVHCQLPARPGPYCCTGCSLAAQLGGAGGSSSQQLLARVVLSAFLSMGVMIVSIALYGSDTLGGPDLEGDHEGAAALGGLYRLAALALSTPAALLIGLPLARAVLQSRRLLSVDVWILLGAGAALALSAWNTLVSSGPVYFETATMILVLVGLGRWIDVRAKERARDRLVQVLPESRPTAQRLAGQEEETVAAETLRVGDLVRVRPGEVVPVDGTVEQGRSFLDTVDLSGESAPRGVDVGASVLAGSRVLDGSLLVRTRAAVGARVCDEMERLLERAMTSGGAHERRAERLAAVMIPSVLAVAAGVFLVVLGTAGLEPAVSRSLSVILVACPCALGIATPLAFWSALARAWEGHMLVKGSEVLERAARVRRVLFDKTGTLTEGRLELAAVESAAGGEHPDEREALRLAAAAEVGSEHPIGAALRRAWAERFGEALPEAADFEATPGVGIAATVDGQRVELCRSGPGHDREFTTVRMDVGGRERALFELRDRARGEVRPVLEELRGAGLDLRVLSGDARGPVESLGREFDVDAEWGLLPHEKVARVRELGAEEALFVGDGMNDAAVLAEAGVGIAVHGGSPRSFEAADVLFLSPGLERVPTLLDLSRTAVRTARFNLAWCLVYNLVGVLLAATGTLTPLLAVAAMVLSGIGVVANTARAFARFDGKVDAGRAEASAPLDGGPAGDDDANTSVGAYVPRRGSGDAAWAYARSRLETSEIRS